MIINLCYWGFFNIVIFMRTYRQLVYMVLDELKLISDDSSFSEEHIMFLLSKYRALLLKQRYSDIKKEVPLSNYQTICLDIEEHEGIEGFPCEGVYMRSTQKIPETIHIGLSRVFPEDYFNGEITYVSKDRFRYVGHNKWLCNIIYATKGPDGYLYLKSSNPQLYYLEKVKFTGVFSDAEEASKLECEQAESCDILDQEFPLEDAIIPPLIELIVKELSGAIYKPEDSENNAADDLANLASFIARNAKSNLQKQIES